MRLSDRGFSATLIATTLLAGAGGSALWAQEAKPFTLQQVLSAPYATSLTAAPVGNLFAWVEDSEGRHNLFVGGANIPARQLTHNTEDDAQDITQLAWAPDASAIAYTYGAESGASGKPANPAHLQRATPVEVVVQPLAAGAQPTVVGEGHLPLFARDGKTLLFIRGGKIWSWDVVTTSTQLVYDRGNASDLTLSPDGTLLAFITRRSEEGQPSHTFLALFDLRTHTLTFPAPSTANDSAPTFSPDGKSLAWLRSPFTEAPEFANPRVSPNPWSIQLLDLASGKTRAAFSPEPNKPGSVMPHVATGEPRLYFTADNHILFFSEADGWAHLYSIDPMTTSAPRLLTYGNFEVEDPTVSGDGKTLLYASNNPDPVGMLDCPAGICIQGRTITDPLDTDRRHLARIDLAASKPAPIAITSGVAIETRPQMASDGTIVALVSDASVPMHPAFVGVHGVGPSLHPTKYATDALVTPQQVLFVSSDGLHLHSQLFLPRNLDSKTKHPAILFVHGGPNRQMLLGYPSMDYYSNAYAMNQYLTSRGFIVLSLNYRCGIGYGIEFRDCIHAGADGATEYNDVLAAAKYLRSRPDVDASRIGIWGGSYGGYLTALALARNSDIFTAGVDFHGVHDWNLEDNASDWRIGGYAQRDAIAAKALASSPLADLSHWTSPILLIHGDDDPDVAYAQTPTLADALRARNATLPAKSQADVEELIFPDELHGFLLHKDWLAAYTAAAAFFERTLMHK
jgi:dipeptidyl aminopeptidase/acylaminoacyl peptidase